MGQRIETDDYGFKKLIQNKNNLLSLNTESNKIEKRMSTFSNDDLLPSLPVPDLDKTLAKYLVSLKPFTNQLEYLNSEKIVNDFKNGVGQKLDFLLRERARKERNWLESFWLDYAYLEGRYPIAPWINTTGFIVGTDELELNNIPCNFKLDIQLANTAIQLYYYTTFFLDLRNETYPAQKSRSSYFSMDQFKRLFNTCRIPLVNKDRIDCHFKTVNEGVCPTYIIIIYKQRFFKLEAIQDNKLLNISEFYAQLEFIVKNYKNKTNGIGLGALTADYRDDWAKNREYLINLDAKNRKNFELIEKSIISVSLDDTEAVDNNELFRVGLCGNPKNRYFDKAYQLVATKNGRLASNTEHSPYDGMVSTTLVVYSIEKRKKEKISLNQVDSFSVRKNIIEPQELDFKYDSKIENEINKSTEIFNKFSSQIEMKELKINSCNKDIIKTYKTNPDTFSQLCMQLAYYQLHNKPGAAYETATTRGYYHGRTETVRSCTLEAIEWCKQMCNKDKSTRLNNQELLKLFKRACAKHDLLMNESRENSGCDRHLLGLRLISRNLNLDLPEIYKDPSWKKSGGDGNFVLSSSCVGYTNSLGGCAAMCENGYAMIYCFSDQGIAYALSRFTTSKETDLKKLSESLESSIKQVQALFETYSKI